MTVAADRAAIAPERARSLLKQMIRIRRFEDKCAELYTEEKIRGFLHLYDGEEAIAVGAITALQPHDRIVATYREHGHALVRGVPMNAVLAEMYGKSAGCSGGRGGSMHLFDRATNFYGGNAIVGGGLPLAVGLALADAMSGRDAVTACFFGEGAVAEGEFHESMNLAALWRLPVLFVCENNRYAMGTSVSRASAQTDFSQRGASFLIPGLQVNGMDVMDVLAKGGKALEHARTGKGPFILEMKTYRYRGHSMSDPAKYRSKEEVQKMRKESDPIDNLRHTILEAGYSNEDEMKDIDKDIKSIVTAAAEFAQQSPEPDESELYTDVFKELSA